MSEIGRPFRLESDTGGLGLSCTSRGISLAGVPLLRLTPSGFAPRPADEIGALIKRAYSRDIDPADLATGLDVIAQALNRDDLGRAMIAALRLRLPELDWKGATRIAKAHDALIKYNPDELRDARGRWTRDGETPPNNSAPRQPPAVISDPPS